jgi:hypothetical protein
MCGLFRILLRFRIFRGRVRFLCYMVTNGLLDHANLVRYHAVRLLRLRRDVMPHGCICPAGANKDCENPACQRKPFKPVGGYVN